MDAKILLNKEQLEVALNKAIKEIGLLVNDDCELCPAYSRPCLDGSPYEQFWAMSGYLADVDCDRLRPAQKDYCAAKLMAYLITS